MRTLVRIANIGFIATPRPVVAHGMGVRPWQTIPPHERPPSRENIGGTDSPIGTPRSTAAPSCAVSVPGAVLLGGGTILDACSSSLKGNSSGGSAASSGKTITIGFVTPLTGPLAGFATSDQFIVDTIRKTPQYSKGIKIGSTTYPVNIVVADSQSDPNRASEVTKQLITQNNADMVVVTSTPEVTNPVASVCEAQGMPCVATVVPWESWYFGRGAKPGTTFTYTTMFFFGIPAVRQCFIPMWNRIPTNKVVALMYPNDADGNAFRDGLPATDAQGGIQDRRRRRLHRRHRPTSPR